MTNGTIIKNTGSWYTVRTDDGSVYSCKVKGNFRLRGIRSTNPVAVGDRVEIKPGDEQGVGLITDILDRRNYIIRKASNLSKQSHILAANVDMVLLLVTVAHPETNLIFVDRYLASAEAYRIPVALVFNKTDLYDESELSRTRQLMSLYLSLGYRCVAASVVQGEGLDEIRSLLAGKTTLLSGNSGVGKSTLLNRLIPGLNVRTEEISEAHDSGLHTTTFSEMYDLPGGGHVIDTPGIKGFGTFDIQPSEVSHYFREVFRIGRDCRFSDCTHTHEPHCAVLQAVADGRIAQSRYTSYLSMLEDQDEEKYRTAY